MTYSVTNTERENYGSLDVVLATVDITSLDAAGAEAIDVEAAFGLSDASIYGVSVRGQESSDYAVTWDHINGAVSVVNVADGTDVASATDVGEVVLEVVGK